MKQKIMDLIFNNSRIFDKIRSRIHDDYKDEKKIISENFKKEKITLDFGCGIGQFSKLFNSKNYHGCDTDEVYINFCKNNHKGNFHTIKENPPYNFKSKYFDQILISAVIHHIDDKHLIEISKELRRILKDNGELIIIDHFTRKYQRNIFCKFLINLDRGDCFRNPKKLMKIFSNEFKVKKLETFRNGPYKDYLLILIKN
jgi:SAM-dependent methyltransferase